MSVLQTLIEQRDAAFEELSNFVAPIIEEKRDMTTDEEVRKAELHQTVVRLDDRIDEVNDEEVRTAKVNAARARITIPAGDGVVRDEPKTYGPGSGHSYFADTCWSAIPGDSHFRDAQDRLDKYGREVVRDTVNDSALRARVVKLTKERYRVDGESRSRELVNSLEARAMDTATGSGGSFVTPQYLVSDYAAYRQFGRVFINDTNMQSLPEYGMTVYLPAVQGPAGVGTQNQNSGVTEGDPTAGYLSSNLTTEAGQVTISQQLLDRAGPGVEFDKIVFDQLQRAYNFAINAAVITAALANAGTVSDTHTAATGAAIMQDVYSDVAVASLQMETAAGVVMSPTNLYMNSTQWAWLQSQLDANGRPLIVPSYAGPFNAVAAALAGKDVPTPEGQTGYELQSLPVTKDNGIPASSANAQLIVAHMPEVWVWEGDLIPRTIPQTYAQNLSILLQVYAYWTCIVRYPKAVQSISGARYPSTQVFTFA